MTREEALELAGKAVLKLVEEPLGDFVYRIRENELRGWGGPRVVNWGEASSLAEKAARALGWDGKYAFQREAAP
jgi:hypothetical protein